MSEREGDVVYKFFLPGLVLEELIPWWRSEQCHLHGMVKPCYDTFVHVALSTSYCIGHCLCKVSTVLASEMCRHPKLQGHKKGIMLLGV